MPGDGGDDVALAHSVVDSLVEAGRLHEPGERDRKLMNHLRVAWDRGVRGAYALRVFAREMLIAEGVDEEEADRAARHAARKFDPAAPPSVRVEPVPVEQADRALDVLAGVGGSMEPLPDAFEDFITAHFDLDDLVTIKTAVNCGHTKTAADWLVDGPPARSGACLQILPNPVRQMPTGGGGCACSADMGRMKNVYVETDRAEIKHKLLPALLRLGLPVVAAVNTGGKSVHCTMRVDCEDVAAWKERVAQIKTDLAPLGLDTASFTHTQVMRLPGVRRVGTSTGGQPVDADQTLIYLNREAPVLTSAMIAEAGRRAREAAAGALDGVLPRLRAAEILTKPWARYIVRGTLCENSLALLYGPSNVGKSFIALDLVCAVGSAPLDGPAITWGPAEKRMYVVPSSVLYISLEGEDTLKGRVMALQACGRWREDTRVDFVTLPIDLFAERVPELIAATALATGAAWGVPCRLIVIDTLSRSIPGRDENSTEVMSQVVGLADKVRLLSQACVLPVHHTGKEIEKGARGSYALTCAVDTSVQVTRTAAGPISMQTIKQRGVALAGEHLMRLEIVEVGRDEWDEPITSCYVHHLTAEEIREVEPTARDLLSLLPQPGYAAWEEAARSAGMSKKTFDTFRKELAREGLCRTRKEGRQVVEITRSDTDVLPEID